jgi:hypothetical protein
MGGEVEIGNWKLEIGNWKSRKTPMTTWDLRGDVIGLGFRGCFGGMAVFLPRQDSSSGPTMMNFTIRELVRVAPE